VPSAVPVLAKAVLEVIVESGAGLEPGCPDRDHTEKDAKLSPMAQKFFVRQTLSLKSSASVRTMQPAKRICPLMRKGQTIVGFLRPMGKLEELQSLENTGVTSFVVELNAENDALRERRRAPKFIILECFFELKLSHRR
jgi:H+-translocating NAD(P) transhydrogenase subunit alpha